jgi:hypothetical protein
MTREKWLSTRQANGNILSPEEENAWSHEVLTCIIKRGKWHTNLHNASYVYSQECCNKHVKGREFTSGIPKCQPNWALLLFYAGCLYNTTCLAYSGTTPPSVTIHSWPHIMQGRPVYLKVCHYWDTVRIQMNWKAILKDITNVATCRNILNSTSTGCRVQVLRD